MYLEKNVINILVGTNYYYEARCLRCQAVLKTHLDLLTIKLHNDSITNQSINIRYNYTYKYIIICILT